MAIGAIIGIISTVFQAVRAFSPPEAQQPQQPQQAADKLFSKLDEMGQGSIGSAELQTAFDRIRTDAAVSADRLFTRLDADGDGNITRNEFSGSINQLAEQLDQHYMRVRMNGEGSLPPPPVDAGFTREELTGRLADIAGNFDRADADGDGRVSLREARAFGQASSLAGSPPTLPTAAADSQNIELMLQVVRLMQAYGVARGSDGSDGNSNSNSAAARLSVLG